MTGEVSVRFYRTSQSSPFESTQAPYEEEKSAKSP